MKFTGKVCIVTGAASGLGKAATEEFAAGGGKAVLSDISEDSGREAVAALSDGGAEAIFVKADASKGEDIQRLVHETVERFGSVDVMGPEQELCRILR